MRWWRGPRAGRVGVRADVLRQRRARHSGFLLVAAGVLDHLPLRAGAACCGLAKGTST